MINATPYETEELDRLRAEQRRLLSVIRESDVRAHVGSEPPRISGPVGKGARKLEYSCRHLARRLLYPHSLYLSLEEQRQQTTSALAFVRQQVEGDGWIETARNSLVGNPAKLEAQLVRQKDVDRTLLRDLRNVALLLEVADLLAEQG